MIWSFYSLATGLFSGRTFSANDRSALAANTPAGCAAIAGRFDRLTQRVDLETGAVVAYERPRAELDAEQRAAQAVRARHRIAELEAQQARRVRELLAETDPRLKAIDAEIATLRPSLK